MFQSLLHLPHMNHKKNRETASLFESTCDENYDKLHIRFTVVARHGHKKK